jgi:hypothetical protein
MVTITKFEDLEVRQKAGILSREIFDYIQQGNFKRDYKLIRQINASRVQQWIMQRKVSNGEVNWSLLIS